MRKYIFFLSTAILLTAGQANAQYFIGPTALGSGNGTSWNNRAAGIAFLNAINSIPSGSTVYMLEGTYSKNGGGGPIFIGAVNNNINIRGGYPAASNTTGTTPVGYNPVSNPTIIDFNGPNTYGAGYWQFTGSTGNIKLQGITFTSTLASGGGKNSKVIGGGDSNPTAGNLVLTDVTITNLTPNVAVIDMVTNLASGGNLTITNSTFSNNSRAVFAGPGTKTIVTGSTFTGNTSSGTTGGAALTIDYHGLSTITNSNFCSNTYMNTSNWAGGGAISNSQPNPNSSSVINITGSSFYNNSSSNGGGAIGLFGVSLFVDGSNFLNNRSTSTSVGGGAVNITASDPAQNPPGYDVGMTIQNSIFYQNSAPNNTSIGPSGINTSFRETGGGAILISGFGPASDGPSSGFVGSKILNNKFVQNSVGSGSSGGAIALYNNDKQFPLSNTAWNNYNNSTRTATLTGNTFYGNYIGSSGNTNATGSDIIAVAQAGGQFIINGGNKMQLAAQASYLNYALFGPNPPGSGGIQFLNPSAGNNGYAFSGANTFGNTTNPFASVIITGCTPNIILLPVKLISFNVSIRNCISNIGWKSATEENFNKYEVEYSTNGIAFVTVNVQNGKGDNSSYIANHTPAAGKGFYRLKMTDNDGKIEYSNVVALDVSCSQSSILIYPNPVTDRKLNINISNAVSSVKAVLYSPLGHVISNYVLQNGNNIIDVSKLTAGVYFIQIDKGNATGNYKIIKR